MFQLKRKIRSAGISLKLTLGVMLVLLAAFAALALAGVRAQEQAAVASVKRSANLFAGTVAKATRSFMLKNQRDHLHQTITAIGQEPGVRSIRVFNKNGGIMFSSRAAEIGGQVEKGAQACQGCHGQGAPLAKLPPAKTSRIFQVAGPDPHRVISVVKPIYSEPACYGDPCHAHPKGQKVLGVLDIGLSLAEVDRELEQTAVTFITWGGAVLLAVCLGVAGFSYAVLQRPLASLVAAARGIAAGDYQRPVPVESRDEIGHLANSFEQMRQAVKQKTEDLLESRQRFQTLFEQVPCYISVQDRDLRLVAFNKMFERDFGARKQAFCYQVYKGRSEPCPVCAVDKAFKDGNCHTAEETVLGRDGKPRHFLNLTAPVFDKAGRVTAVMEMATDITPLRELERELRASEEKYRLFFDIDPNPIFVFERESFAISEANRRAAQVYGRPKDELLGASLLLLAPAEVRPRLREFLEGEEDFFPRLPQVAADGKLFYVNLRVARLFSDGRGAIIAAADDLTETINAEQRLVQAAKMATLGEMSAGVAHELNQPLTVVGAAAGYLNKLLDKGAALDPVDLAEVAEEVAGQVERARRIIDHLRAFGRKSEVERELVDINRPIVGVLGLVGRQLEVHDIKVELDLAQGLPPVWAGLNRLEQVFTNLVLNARDAVEERMASEPIGERGKIMIKTWARDDRVLARVEDNGRGFSPALADKVFEPFFTTKQVGKGTGLGLSISYGILRDFGGGIEAANRPGGGAAFTLWLPTAGEGSA